MCGIAGIVNLEDKAPVSRELLSRMCDVIRHRGPDDSGLWFSEDGKVGLGFRRLAIVVWSAKANQPMANEDGSIHVVFNGEI